MKRIIIPILLGFIISFSLSCSGSSTVTPDTESPTETSVKQEIHTSEQNTHLWGIWDVNIDPETGRIEAVPMRGAYFSCNVTRFIDKPPPNLLLTNFLIDTSNPTYVSIGVDVGIQHPFPGLDNLYGFDVIGVFFGNGSEIYPGNESLYIAGDDDQLLMNPDGYTRWFNWAEFYSAGQQMPIFGYTPGQLGNIEDPSANLNPYKYFADGIGTYASAINYLENNPDSRGRFSPGATNFRNYQLRFLKGDISFQYAVIAHWIPPEGSSPYTIDDFPIGANADEALLTRVVDSSTFHVTGDHTCAGDVILDISVWDWTAVLNADGVMDEYQIKCFSDVWSGAYEVPMIPVEQEEHFYTFNATIPIDFLDTLDPIPVWIEVSYPDLDYSNIVGIINEADGLLAGYSFAEVPVYPEPVDVSPQWPNYRLRDICVYGDHAYIAGRIAGGGGSFLNIWDVSDPYNPISIKWLEIPGSARGLAVAHGHAFIAAGSRMVIVRIDDPLNAHIINESEVTGGHAKDVFVQDDKAYVPVHGDGFNIFHVAPAENTYHVNTVYDNALWQNTCVYTEGEYAYVGARNFIILDINPPESASIICKVETPRVNAVSVSNGYAYLATECKGSCGGPPGLAIIDVSDPESGSLVKLLEEPGDTYDVFVQGDYAYATNFYDLYIIDINQPETAYVAEIVDMGQAARAVWVKDEYAYVVGHSSFKIVHIDPTGSSEIIWSYDVLMWPLDVCVEDEYAYIADGYGLRIIDIDPIQDAEIISTVSTPGKAHKVDISDGLAYVVDDDLGLYIIGINPPESASLIKYLEIPSRVFDVICLDGYAYVTADAGLSNNGLYIFDTDPPEMAYLVNMVVTGTQTEGIDISGNYAFLAGYYSGIEVVDIDPPEDAYICQSITDLPGHPTDIFVIEGYAYTVGEGQKDLMIIDIDPLEEAHIVNSVTTIGKPEGLYVSGGYAYISSYKSFPYSEGYLHIIDVDPVESSLLVHSIDLPFLPVPPSDVYVYGNHLFVADNWGGLLIFEIWN